MHLVQLKEAVHGRLLPPVWMLCDKEEVCLAANHISIEETSSVHIKREKTVNSLDSLALWKVEGCAIPFSELPSLQQSCFMRVLKVWDSQCHKPCASKHLRYLKRLTQSTMSPAVNHGNFTRKNADWAAYCHNRYIFRMLQHSNGFWSRFCCFDTVSLEASRNIWVMSLWYEIYLPPPLFANSRNLGFFCFLLARDNWNISKIMSYCTTTFTYRGRLHEVPHMVCGY